MTDRNENSGQGVEGARPKYRDDDDTRGYLAGDDRAGTHPDSKSEARGDAREEVGNNSRGTAPEPAGPEGNDRTRQRPQPDSFDADLAEDNERGR